MQPVAAARAAGSLGHADNEGYHTQPPPDGTCHRALAACHIEPQHTRHAPVSTTANAPSACAVPTKERRCNVLNKYRPLRAFLSADPVSQALWKYVSTGETEILLPLLRNPPDWREVLVSLRQFYIAASIAPHRIVKHYSPLHRVISWDKMFMTQLPVRETIEAVGRVIDYFRDHLAPKVPLVIAGIASGNAIYERAILEYFRTRQKPKRLANDLIQISDNLLMHCSDLYDRTECYRSTPMLPVARMDYQKAVNHITQSLPEAAILPFAAWIPPTKNGWFDVLAQCPAVIGFIHLRDLQTCGRCSASRHTIREQAKANCHNPGLIKPGTVFSTEVFNVLGWGANDSLEDSRGENILLTTQLEVKYPRSAFGGIELPAHLLYSDLLRSQAFCNLPLKRRKVSGFESH